MDKDQFKKLISLGENKGVDFKERYYDNNNNASLVHDVLCMANAKIDGERYIIFGVSDDKKLVGLEPSIKHKQNDLIQIFRNANPNRSIYNSLNYEEFEVNGKKFAVITIENRPDKPFFLQKDFEDKKDKKKTVRAGVIYTRNADGNTPIDKSALDDEIEMMWRERFCLNFPPLQRFDIYLSNENWIKASDDSYYCEQYPEFRLKLSGYRCIPQNVPNNDRWMPKYWMGREEILVQEYRGYYFDMCIVEKDITIWWCDNGREPVPLPTIKSSASNLEELENAEYSWEISRHSLEYKVANVIAKAHSKNLKEIINQTKIKIID